ncbi:UNVERIFIED_CONTAM: hypothetical protein GTU68_028634 [Idotea baltica]|nr:hypothetical protein [Idotea baltica]
MDIKYSVHPTDVKSYDTKRLREEFHTGNLMQENEIVWVYTHYDRFMYGGVVPTNKPISLDTQDELKSNFFLERRELGIMNVGEAGSVTVDGETYQLEKLDMLYVGRGQEAVSFESNDAKQPARFYLNSTPAHKEFPTVLAKKSDANVVELGSQATANERTLFQYIHEDGVQSCQLVMGYTELKPGNIWNTFPPHTHERRMEVYFYFDVPDEHIVLHLMGQPQETRHIMMHNEDAVVSPPWSIHSGAGTSNYKFIWGMGGENKAFTDMDGVPMREVL